MGLPASAAHQLENRRTVGILQGGDRLRQLGATATGLNTVTVISSKARVMALIAGDSWLETGANLILFGPPGGGNTHLVAVIGLGLSENGWRVLFTRTTGLVQKLQVARRELTLEAAIARLDKHQLITLDDLA